MSAAEHKGHAPRRLRVGVLTVSDTRTEAGDESGQLARALLERSGHEPGPHAVVKDEPRAIREAMLAMLPACDALVLNGGTGISPRDVTIETVEPMLDKRLPGFGELFRALSYRDVGSAAMLSRATAGILQGKPVFALPGSPAAVRLGVEHLVLPELGHLAAEAVKGTGAPHDPLRR